MENLCADYLIDLLEPYARWIGVGLAAILVVAVAVLYFTKSEKLKRFLKIYLIVFFAAALVGGIFMLSLDVYKHFNAAYLEEKWVNKNVVYFVLIPLAATFILSIASAGTVLILQKKNSCPKSLIRILIAVCAVALLTSLVLIAVYYFKYINGDGYYTAEGANFNQIHLYVSAEVVLLVIFLPAYFLGGNSVPFNAKVLARAGICLSLSFALSYVKLFSMPQGGSITLASMLPIMIFSYIYGTKKGVFLGFVYGILQSLQSPYIIHPAQFLLDYPIAFAALGLAGILKDVKLPHAVKFVIGIIIGGAVRYVSHVLSGVFAFGAYAEGQNILLYSLAYNSFVFVDLILVAVVGIILMYNKNFRTLLKV